MGKIAFIFSGQGAQYPGMGIDLYSYSNAFKKVLDMAEKSILDICFNGPSDMLNQTIYTQPCMFLMGLGCAAALEENNILCQGTAGFSIGELAALAYSKAFTQKNALDTVMFRAEVMASCAKEHKGIMYAVLGLEDMVVEKLCKKIKGCYPVNYNCPKQVVVSMLADTEEDFLRLVNESCIKVIKLKVSGAFHSPFMKKAEEDLEKYMGYVDFKKPDLCVYSNVTAKPYEGDYRLLCKQVSHSVLWKDIIANMIKDGFDVFIENGSNGVLTNMIKRIDNKVRTFNVYDVESLKAVTKGLLC